MTFVQQRVHANQGGFGASLRELRELRGYSLDDVARATGIHSAILSLFEEDRVTDLSDPVYAERHVRKLVKLLEGREEYYIDKYRSLLVSRELVKDATPVLRRRVRKRDLFVSSRVVAFGGFLLLVALIAGYVIWQATQLSSKPMLTVTAPVDGFRLTGPRVEITGRTDPGSLVDVNGDQAVVDASGAFRVSLLVPRGLTTLEIRARRRYGSAAIEDRHVMYTVVAPTGTAPVLGPVTSTE